MNHPLYDEFDESVLNLEGVERTSTRYAEWTYQLHRRQVAHLHSDGGAHFPFPRSVRDELLEEEGVDYHPINSDSGWLEVEITDRASLEAALKLARRSYERAVQANRKKNSQ